MAEDIKTLWAKDQVDDFAERWAKYWKAPGRPTPQEIDFLRDFISKKQQSGNVDVLILGSTTEYRDLMFELGIKPTIVDISLKNYKTLSQALKHGDDYQNRETFFEQKWQEISIDKKFDIVLGHFALGVNPFDTWKKVLRSVHDHLKDGGLLITNNWINDGNKMTIDDVAKEYKEKWQKEHTLFGSMMPKIFLTARNEKNEVHYPDLCNIIDQAHIQGKISDEDYKYYEDSGFQGRDNFVLFIPSEEEFRQLVGEYFTIQEKVILEPYPNAYLMPEWVLQKK